MGDSLYLNISSGASTSFYSGVTMWLGSTSGVTILSPLGGYRVVARSGTSKLVGWEGIKREHPEPIPEITYKTKYIEVPKQSTSR